MIKLELTSMNGDKLYLTGYTFTVAISRSFKNGDTVVVQNGNHNNGGYHVREAYNDIVKQIEEQTYGSKIGNGQTHIRTD